MKPPRLERVRALVEELYPGAAYLLLVAPPGGDGVVCANIPDELQRLVMRGFIMHFRRDRETVFNIHVPKETHGQKEEDEPLTLDTAGEEVQRAAAD